MTTSKLIAIALAALLVFAGAAAAAPGGSSGTPGADAADEHRPDDLGADASDQANETDGNETDADEASADAADERDENATDAPPTEMPEQAPDHVTQIHDLIREKLDGALTGQELGEALSGLVGNADETEANGQADEAGEQSEEADDARANADDAGPPSDLPEPVPDHVSQLHDLIVSFLNGDGEGNLGTQISAAASG